MSEGDDDAIELEEGFLLARPSEGKAPWSTPGACPMRWMDVHPRNLLSTPQANGPETSGRTHENAVLLPGPS